MLALVGIAKVDPPYAQKSGEHGEGGERCTGGTAFSRSVQAHPYVFEREGVRSSVQ